MLGNSPVAPLRPLFILEKGLNRPANIRPGAAQAVIPIRPAGVEGRVPLAAWPDLGGDGLDLGLARGLQAMVAIGQPIGGAIMEDHDGGEYAAGGHRRGVVVEDGTVNQRRSLLDGVIGLD